MREASKQSKVKLPIIATSNDFISLVQKLCFADFLSHFQIREKQESCVKKYTLP